MTARRRQGGDDEPTGREYLKADRWGQIDVAREFRLTTSQALLLRILVELVDYQRDCFCWTGTLDQLADRTGMGRNTVSKALHRLCDLGLVVEVEPFGGHGLQGTVVVPAYYDVFVVPGPKRRDDFASTSALNGAQLRARCASTARRLRVDFAPSDAQTASLPAGTPEREVLRLRGMEVRDGIEETEGGERLSEDTAIGDDGRPSETAEPAADVTPEPAAPSRLDRPTLGAFRGQESTQGEISGDRQAESDDAARLLAAFPGAEETDGDQAGIKWGAPFDESPAALRADAGAGGRHPT